MTIGDRYFMGTESIRILSQMKLNTVLFIVSKDGAIIYNHHEKCVTSCTWVEWGQSAWQMCGNGMQHFKKTLTNLTNNNNSVTPKVDLLSMNQQLNCVCLQNRIQNLRIAYFNMFFVFMGVPARGHSPIIWKHYFLSRYSINFFLWYFLPLRSRLR